jgi:glycosyltransferase involved in cell wall biosynthesis
MPKTTPPRSSTKITAKPTTPYLSVIVPLLDEEDSLKELYQQIVHSAGSLGKPFEIIFVDDGSTDNSFCILQELHAGDARVKAVRFRRNFGKSAALSVGFHEAQGEIVITLDADLQDDPAEIPSLIETLEKGYDLVSGWKQRRHDPLSKTIPSRLANSVTAMMTGIPIHDMNCGLKAYRKDVVKNINVYGELHRYIPALAHWAGFRVGEKVVQHHPRKYGHTKFGISRLSRGFLDLLTVLFTTRYIRRPLHLFGVWGLISFMIGVLIDGYLSVEWLLGRTSLSNRPLFLVGFLFIIIGAQFVSFGLLGEMINRQQRDETTYSIKETLT